MSYAYYIHRKQIPMVYTPIHVHVCESWCKYNIAQVLGKAENTENNHNIVQAYTCICTGFTCTCNWLLSHALMMSKGYFV